MVHSRATTARRAILSSALWLGGLALAEYRLRYAWYRSDRLLREAHAACPWVLTHDDHEVDNDYAGMQSEHPGEQALFAARRAAAYQAYYEHQPLPRDSLGAGGG